MEYYNTKAELNTIPFLQVTGYNVSVYTGQVNTSTSIGSVYDIPDYITKTNNLITSTNHNSFKAIQGGKAGEYYHFTSAQYTKLLALIHTAPTTSISLLSTIPSSTNGVYERGTTITNVRVQGSTVINDAGTHTSSKYLIDNVLIETKVDENKNDVFTATTNIKSTTTIKYQASYSDAPMKESFLQLKFDLPYYSALDTAGKTFVNLNKTKVLTSKPSQANISYNIPQGNAISSTPVMPYAYFPTEWGDVVSVGANNLFTFDYLGSFNKTVVSVQLLDGTTATYNKYEYTTATQGNMTFNFKF
jgi:hypothetical protein